MVAAKTDEKTAWRIVSDPIAEERQWMAACTVVGGKQAPQTRVPILDRIPDSVHAWGSSAGALLCSIALFFFAFTTVNQLGNALAIADKFTTWSDWYSGIMWMVGLPSMTSVFAGFLQRKSEKGNAWMLAWVPWLFFGGLSSLDLGLWVIPYAISGIMLSHLAYLWGRKLSSFWRAHQGTKHPMRPMTWVVLGTTVFLWSYFFARWAAIANSPHVQSSQSEGMRSVIAIAIFSLLFGSITSMATGGKQLATRVGAALSMQAPMIMFFGVTLVAGLFYAVGTALTGAFDAGVLAIGVLAPIVGVAPSVVGSALVWKVGRMCGRN